MIPAKWREARVKVPKKKKLKKGKSPRDLEARLYNEMLSDKMKRKLKKRLKRARAAEHARQTVDKATLKAIQAIQKKHGKDSLGFVTGSRQLDIKSFDTGFPELNDLFTGESDDDNNTIEGTGFGLPYGRIIEIYGPESSGKTTLTLHMIRAAQEAGETCAFIDAEHALDTNYARKLGVNLNTLLLEQPSSAESALEMVMDICKSKRIKLVVIDSVAGLVPQIELKKEMGETVVAAQARLMSQALRKLASLANKSGTTIIFTNQLRMKIGVMFGNPETTPGGNSLKYYASIRIDIRKVKTIKKGTAAVGHRARIRCVKNKVAPPFREVHADIKPNRGIVRIHVDPGFGKKGKEETE